MTRLAGITAVYALIAALLLATPLSASEDPEAQPAAPTDATAGPEGAAPETPGPEPTAPEAVAPEAPPPEAIPPSEPATPAVPPPAAAPAPEPAASAPAAAVPAQPAPGEPKPRRSGPAPRATAAADTSVTISDFQFAPAAITIDAGDTVTWTNDGPTPHSATAEDGSFDTGIYEQGQSRSHTFDQAGTFGYFCTPHPNMRGTVTVRAPSSGGQGGGGGEAGGTTGGESGSAGTDAGTAGSGAGSSGDSSGAALPATGVDTGGLAVLGLVTLALGAWLRRRSAAAG